MKLGGSIVTVRERYCTSNIENIDRITSEIARALKEKPLDLVIVIGGGSYGHQVAAEYDLHKGLMNERQLPGLYLITTKMWENAGVVSAALYRKGLLPFHFQTPAIIVSDDANISISFYDAIERALKLGLIPVLWGDVAFDDKRTFTIVSGDKIIVSLAQRLGAQRLLNLSDIDGVLSGYGTPQASVIRQIDKHNASDVLREIKDSDKVDVTDGMRGKLSSLIEMAERQTECFIGNGNRPELIYDLLMGHPVEGTYIR
jgi:isopentenyl phosphate kinase